MPNRPTALEEDRVSSKGLSFCGLKGRNKHVAVVMCVCASRYGIVLYIDSYKRRPTCAHGSRRDGVA